MANVAVRPVPDEPIKSLVVAGILLEYTPVEHVLKSLGLASQEELEAILAPSAKWPHHGHQDGWKMAHDAIRFDMDALLAAIAKTKELVDGGRALEAWQVQALQHAAKEFHHFTHHHHDNEEEIFFPFMESRVQVPPKMTADHKQLVQMMDRTRDLCLALKAGAPAAQSAATLADLLAVMASLRTSMRQHLEEEEIVGLPLLRQHFSARDVEEGPEKKLLAGLKASDMAWFLRPLAMPQKRETMTRFGVPGLIQTLVLLPAVRKDARRSLHPLQELAKGERSAPPKKKGFLCFAA